MGWRTTQTALASALRTIAGGVVNSADLSDASGIGAQIALSITANTGAFTLDVKLQGKDPLSSTYYDVPGAAFAQKSATGTSVLVVYPGITASANVAVSQVLPRIYRVVATPGGGGTDITYSVSIIPVS